MHWIKTRALWVAAFLGLSLVCVKPGVHSYSEVLQVSLPLAGLGCAAATGNMPGYFTRYAAMWVSVKGTKSALGDAPINQRPNGRSKGFPSTHTASAVFGASSLVQSCLNNAPLLKTAIVTSAAFAGASRVESDHHSVIQVLAGAVYALFFERLLRRGTPLRQRVMTLVRATYPAQHRAWRWLIDGVNSVLHAAHQRVTSKLPEVRRWPMIRYFS